MSKDRIKFMFVAAEFILMVFSATFMATHLSEGNLLDATLAFLCFFTCFALLYKDMDNED